MRKTIYILLLLTIHLSSQASDITVCDDFLDDCNFYACIQAEVNCGTEGYPLAFGKKYCLKFDKKAHKLSINAKKWADKTKTCLIQKLLNNYRGRSCKEIKKQAFKDHVQCYYQSGYCELSGKEKRSVIKTIKGSLWKPRLIRTGLKLLNLCRKEKK